MFSAHSLTRIEELLEECFNALENYTGQLTAHLSWQCPQSNPDLQLAGYKVLVDGKQYGSPMHAGVRTVRVQVNTENQITVFDQSFDISFEDCIWWLEMFFTCWKSSGQTHPGKS